ncbi:MAG: hypothetical protein M3081_06390 [Gemmatimonadota bacterium]|nr:hypothetical protein [Gemmatimonadota bacterium]
MANSIHSNSHSADRPVVDVKAQEEAEHQARLQHAKDLEDQAAKLERENADLRVEKAAQDRLHKAQEEHDQLQHPSSLPFPLNVLLHTQVENEGTHSNVVAVADTSHVGGYEVHANEHDGETHAVEAVAHPADDHPAQDSSHVIDHSHDADAAATA